MKQKIAFGIEYDGRSYSGWQRQKHTTRTIQEFVEKAISHVANEGVTVYCAGRTDRGVHATGQVVHIETGVIRSMRSWIRGVNTRLPDDISVKWVQSVTDDFHARYSARRRSYRYIIDNTALSRGAINRRRSAWVYRSLDELLMAKAAQSLIGKHDFTSFRAVACQAKTPVKKIDKLEVYRCGEFVVLDIEADAFLHHMVRNIAGVLIAIGIGDQDVTWCKQVLEARDRTKGGVTAKPEGLYMTGVKYPDRFNIPYSDQAMVIL